MGDGIHRLTANMRSATHMTLAARFTQMDMLMIRIADLPDRRSTGSGNHPHFAARHDNMGPFTLFRRDALVVHAREVHQ